MKVLSAKPSEYEEIQRFLEEAYGHSFNFFNERWLKVWKKDYTDFENILIIKEKQQIISLVRIFPLMFIQKGVRIKTAGIGNVSTLYSHRGKGYMSCLLEESFCRMRKEKYPVSVLWGDRHRYGYFGYENCGSNIVLRINVRGINKMGIKQVDPKRYFGQSEALEKIIDIYNTNSYRKQRTKKDFTALYAAMGVATYYAEKGKEFAYLSIASSDSGAQGTVKEYGGNSELLLGILKYLNERFGHDSFVLVFPDMREIPDILLAASSNWEISKSCMLKIINLKETLRLFSQHPDFHFPEGEEITFTIKDGESATIVKQQGILSIREGKGRNEIVLDETGMVRLLFGTYFWAPADVDSTTLQMLKMFLPFKFFVWRMDTV